MEESAISVYVRFHTLEIIVKRILRVQLIHVLILVYVSWRLDHLFLTVYVALDLVVIDVRILIHRVR